VADGDGQHGDVALFTNDRVDLSRYTVTGLHGTPERGSSPFLQVDDQVAELSDEEVDALVPVRRLTGDDLRPYYGIGYEFVRRFFLGQFKPGSMVLLMGCDSLRGRRLSEAFLARGAGVVIGWSDQVSAAHGDESTAVLVHHLAQGVPVDEALRLVMTSVGPDPNTGAHLIAAVN
jgi:hypothetical protein